MAKTVLRSVLIILILAGLVFFGLQYMEKQKQKGKTPSVTQEEAMPPKVAVSQIRTTEMPKGALVQISEVPGPGYRLSPLPLPSKGVLVEIPEVDLRLLKNTIVSPHPLIESIEASKSVMGGQPVARIEINLKGEPSYRDRLIGTTLYVELAGEVPAQEPVVEATVPPTPKPKKIAKPKPKPKKKMAKRKPKPKPRRKIVKKATPTPTPEPAPIVEDEPMFDEEPMVAEEMDEGTPDVAAPEASDMEDDIDLDELFGEEGSGTFEGGDVADAPQVAAIPEAKPGTFDSNVLPDNLPSINTISVGDEGGITTVRINRDAATKYKIFRMINPNRVVVDFKDAKNGLNPQYGAFGGTRVKKITTRQFAGPDGAITRVMVYVDGMPQYQKAVEGNDFVLKLP